MAKAVANYVKLANEAEVRVDGFQARVTRMGDAIEKELKGHPKVAEIRTLIDKHALAMFDLQNAIVQFKRYVDLRDNPGQSKGGS